MCQVNTVVFDKTGTVTYGVPHIANVLMLTGDKSTNALRRLLAIIGTAESCSEHPMAGAIVKHAKSVSQLHSVALAISLTSVNCMYQVFGRV